MTDFKVGDKVTHRDFTEVGEIKYGPYQKAGTYLTGYYLVDFGDDTRRELRGAFLSAAPTFAVDDTVDYFPGAVFDGVSIRVKLVAGPFKSEHHDEAIWVVEKSNGTHMTPTENALRKVAEEIKVGDRVRVVKDDSNTKPREFIGRLGRVLEVKHDGRELAFRVKLDDPSGTWDEGAWWVAEVELVDEPSADTFTYDGAVYDLTARYSDRDGDAWRFSADPLGDDGTPRGRFRDRSYFDETYTLAYVVREYGPLEKIDN